MQASAAAHGGWGSGGDGQGDQGNGNGHGNGWGNGHGNGWGNDNGHGNGNDNPWANSAGAGNGNGNGRLQIAGITSGGGGNSQGNGNGNSNGDGNANGNGDGNGHGHAFGHSSAYTRSLSVSQTTAPVTESTNTAASSPSAPAPVSPPAPVVAPSAPVTPAAPSTPAPAPAAAPTPVATPTPIATAAPITSTGTGLALSRPDRRLRGGGSVRVAPLGLILRTPAGTAAAAITGTLAPGTAGVATTTAAAKKTHSAPRQSTPHNSGHGLIPLLNNPAAMVIERFISVIPLGVWIALAVSLGLAAVGGGAALRSSRRARQRAGEVAAVTAAALTDPLTGVLNRRGFSEAAERELIRAHRYDHPLALAFVDVRGLKAVNDSEGHLAGDRLLKQVSLLLRESARTSDIVGRIGGDELAVLLVEQSAEGAAAMTQRVRHEIPAHRAQLGLTTDWDVTIGTATFPEDGDSIEQLLEKADRRLYEQRGIELSPGNGATHPQAHS